MNTKPSALSARQARSHASAKIAAFSTAKYPNSRAGAPADVATRNGARNPPAIARPASGCESARSASTTVSTAMATSSANAGHAGSTSYRRNAANVVR